MMPIARSVDRNLKFPLVPSFPACSLNPPWTVNNRYMITPVGPGLGAASYPEDVPFGGFKTSRSAVYVKKNDSLFSHTIHFVS